MRERDFVDQFAELAARVKRIERWQDQWGTRDRKVASLHADGVQSSGGYLVSATQGLAANFHKELDLASQEFPAGWTVMESWQPASGYHSIVPAWWEMPAKEGKITPTIAFIMSDDSSVLLGNATAGRLTRTRADLELNKDGLAIKEIRFQVWNEADAAETQDLGLFKFEGEQF